MINEVTTKSGPKWVGTLLSVIFPCFGFVWAGQYKRAASWLASLLFISTLAFVLLSFDQVPIAVGATLLSIAIGIQLTMWVKSYQRGRLSAARWIALIAYGIVYFTVPLPASYFVRAFLISSESMSPTLLGHIKNDDGDHILVNKLSYLSSGPQRGDIIAFDTSLVPALAKRQGPEAWTYYTFRVLGLPGEQLEIKNGKIIANGSELGPENGVPPFHYRSAGEIMSGPLAPKGLPKPKEGEYLVFGDNTMNSYDSRFWGIVPREAIIGKVTRIYYPLSRINAPLFPQQEP